MAKILIVEDEQLLSAALDDTLKSEGHTVTTLQNGGDAMALVAYSVFDLLILDWHLPEASGLSICKAYRMRGRAEPVLFLTSRSDITDKENAFDSGADDYLTKPFQLRELLSRVKALLRRPVALIEDIALLGSASFDRTTGTLSGDNRSIKLQPREAELLDFFLRRPNQVFRTEQVMSGAWGSDFEGSDVAIRSCLTKLRKALAEFGLEKSIQTIHGFGYCYKPAADGRA